MNKQKIYRIVMIILLLIDMFLSIVNVWILIKYSNKEEASNEIETYSFPELEDTKYFKLHDISTLTMPEIFEKGDEECLVYFFSTTCSSCQQTKEYLSAFIYYDQIENIDIYFVDIGQNEDLITDEELTVISPESYKIAYTPTMLQFKDDEVLEFIGPQEILQLLNSYAKQDE